MGYLNPWQRIDRVIRGRPYGDGREGVYTSTTIPSLTVRNGSGTNSSGQKTLVLTSLGFTNGDVVLIHQTRGDGVENWEINKIVNGGGTNTLYLLKDLHYTFTGAGTSQFQVIKVLMYSDISVTSGIWNISAWDKYINGLFIIASRGSGILSNGINGNGCGFFGGPATNTDGSRGFQSEGNAGDGTATRNYTKNGNGGGGGDLCTGATRYGGGGAGGGSGTAGDNAQPSYGTTSGTGNQAQGGDSCGSSDGTTIGLGGGGGGGSSQSQMSGKGGKGGAIMMLFIKHLDCSSASAISLNGEDGEDISTEAGGGGGGGGGQILICCETAVLGSDKITAHGGDLGVGGFSFGGGSTIYGDGGHGAEGRIAIHHSGIVTGSTSPNFTDILDTSLKEKQPGIGLLMKMLES